MTKSIDSAEQQSNPSAATDDVYANESAVRTHGVDEATTSTLEVKKGPLSDAKQEEDSLVVGDNVSKKDTIDNDQTNNNSKKTCKNPPTVASTSCDSPPPSKCVDASNSSETTTTSVPGAVPSSPSSKKRAASSMSASTTDDKGSNNNGTGSTTTNNPPVDVTKPIKRARTAYFIFSDENRSKIQAEHPGEGVAVVARILGQMWSQMTPEVKKTYVLKAAEERERVAKQLEHFKSLGIVSPEPATSSEDPSHLSLPVARIRKICKLDPEIKGFSKEAVVLVTKCSELVLSKLGAEAARVANIQNRRTLLPDDVAQVCSTREQFLFLREDLKDLVRDQIHQLQDKKRQKETNKAEKDSSCKNSDENPNSKPLTAYFAPKE